MPNHITNYERVAVNYIENQLIPSQRNIKLWADGFNDATIQRTQTFFGHRQTERSNHLIHPVSGNLIYSKRYTFEVRVEIFTLRNHQEALDLIEYIIDDVLAGFRPFWEFAPFLPQSSGEVSRNRANGSWIYSATGVTEIMSDVEELTSTMMQLPTAQIIKIGFYNAESPTKNIGIIGEFERNG